eukprot:6144524-Prymnesium_polylepis.2
MSQVLIAQHLVAPAEPEEGEEGEEGGGDDDDEGDDEVGGLPAGRCSSTADGCPRASMCCGDRPSMCCADRSADRRRTAAMRVPSLDEQGGTERKGGDARGSVHRMASRAASAAFAPLDNRAEEIAMLKNNRARPG